MKTISRRGFSLLLGSTGLLACTGSSEGTDGGVGTDGGIDVNVGRDAGTDGGAIDARSEPLDAAADVGGQTDASTTPDTRFEERTKTVSADATGGGDGSPDNPWTLTQAMALAVAGDIVGLLPGRYVGRQPQRSIDDDGWRNNIPAWAPANNGTADAPIVFVAQHPAAFHDRDRTELYSGAAHMGSARRGWPCFGTRATEPSRYIEWIGIYADEADAEGHIDLDCGVVTCWNADHITIADCHIVGNPEESGGDNYSAIRLEGVEDVWVRGNILEGFYGGGGTNHTGITLYGVDRLVVEQNDFLRCAHGIQPKGANYGFEMREMTVRRNRFAGCTHALRLHRPVANPGGARSRIYQNIVEDTRYFFEITTSGGEVVFADTDIFNNTIVRARDGGDPGCFWWAGRPSGGDNRIFNNIFFDADTYFGSYNATADEISAFAAFDYNCLDVVRSTFGGSRALRDLSFADWQVLHGQDGGSITEDPMLRDDYRLEAGSPCVAAGRDLLGTFGPIDAPVNMGAFVVGDEVIGVG